MTQREFYCGLDAALAVVGGRWKFLVLWQLAVSGPQNGAASTWIASERGRANP